MPFVRHPPPSFEQYLALNILCMNYKCAKMMLKRLNHLDFSPFIYPVKDIHTIRMAP